jgi:hypothetical protein
MTLTPSSERGLEYNFSVNVTLRRNDCNDFSPKKPCRHSPLHGPEIESLASSIHRDEAAGGHSGPKKTSGKAATPDPRGAKSLKEKSRLVALVEVMR